MSFLTAESSDSIVDSVARNSSSTYIEEVVFYERSTPVGTLLMSEAPL